MAAHSQVQPFIFSNPLSIGKCLRLRKTPKFDMAPHFKYFDLDQWTEFQANLSLHLDISLGLYDIEGNALVFPSKGGKLNDVLQLTQMWENLREDSFTGAIKKAVEKNKPYIYECIANQSIFIIPVKLNKDTSIAIVGGHLYASESDLEEFFKKT